MTVEKALINNEKFAFGTDLKAWLTQIMRNIHLDIQKSTVSAKPRPAA